MKYFLDTEFIEAGPHKPIDLLSIALVAEDGREFYLESSEADLGNANEWVKENVLPHLVGGPVAITLSGINGFLLGFCDAAKYGKPEFWGYYADYDWVVFAQIFGSMINLPKGWPMYCNDIKQLCKSKGDPELPKQSSTEHDALNDARWNKQAFEFLMGT